MPSTHAGLFAMRYYRPLDQWAPYSDIYGSDNVLLPDDTKALHNKPHIYNFTLFFSEPLGNNGLSHFRKKSSLIGIKIQARTYSVRCWYKNETKSKIYQPSSYCYHQVENSKLSPLSAHETPVCATMYSWENASFPLKQPIVTTGPRRTWKFLRLNFDDSSRK